MYQIAQATEQQIQAIKKIAAQAKIGATELETQAQEIFGKTITELDRIEAGQFIKILQGQAE